MTASSPHRKRQPAPPRSAPSFVAANAPDPAALGAVAQLILDRLARQPELKIVPPQE